MYWDVPGDVMVGVRLRLPTLVLEVAKEVKCGMKTSEVEWKEGEVTYAMLNCLQSKDNQYDRYHPSGKL
jgi:hypothetical protein